MSGVVDRSEEVQENYDRVEFGPKTLVIPKEWDVKRFGDIFHRRKESIDADETDSIRYVGLKNINSGELEIDGYDENGQERSSSRAFREGDVLFGKLRPNLNKAAIAPFDGICSSDIIPIYAEDETLQRYLPYLMHSKLIRDRAVSTMEGTNLPRTSWDDLKVTKVPIPPKSEQTHIVDILSTVDERIQQTDREITIREELRQGLIRDLIRDGLDSHETVNKRIGPKEYPIARGWQLMDIADVATGANKAIRGGPSGSQLKEADYGEKGAKVYGQENVSSGNFSIGNKYLAEGEFEDFASVEILPDDVLVTMMGTVGDSAVFPDDAEKGIMDSHLLRIRVDQDIILPEFLSILIDESKIIEDQIYSLSHGLVMSGLNIGIVESLTIPVPSISEQKQFVKILSTASEGISAKKQMRSQLQELKRGLMQDLLTGVVRVNTDTG